jgi:hypothetical protein
MDPRPDREHKESFPDRQTGCKWYGRCLDHALTSGWPGFECSRCGDYEQDRLGPEESRAETEGCVLLLWAIEHPEEWQGLSLGRSETERSRRVFTEDRFPGPGAGDGMDCTAGRLSRAR